MVREKKICVAVLCFIGSLYFIKHLDLDLREDISAIDKKVTTAYNHNFKVSLSLKPVFYSKHEYIQDFYKLIDRIAEQDKYEPDMFKRSKISVKLRQIGKNDRQQEQNFMSLLERAQNKNVFVWISAVKPRDLDYEFSMYKKARANGFNNVGLTICTYNKNCHQKVDQVLAMNGHVRLVKGFYSGDIKDWTTVSQNFLDNARKLCASGRYHFLASHDFKILNTLNKEFGTLANTEVGFFYHAKNHVFKQMAKYALNFPNKSFYVYYGDNINYLLHNALHIDGKRFLKRRIISKFMDSERIRL